MWHEYKTYRNYLYIISDDVGTGFQIADLSYLPDSVHILYDSTGLFERAHTIFIDNNKMYLGSVSKGPYFSSMNVYSLADPVHPTLLRRLDQDFFQIGVVHDMYVKNDTIYASCGYDGLFIFRYDSIANQFILLSTLQDNTNIYNHSSALSSDRSTLYVCEELPAGRPVKIVDVAGINAPTLLSTFYSNVGATPHNPEVKGNKLILSYYMDGVYVYDITNATNPVQIGFFDTYPANSPGSYPTPSNKGCWSTFSGLPSGILLASDMQSGLFVLDVSALIGVDEFNDDPVLVFPNPVNNYLRIRNINPARMELYDVSGKLVVSVVSEQEETQIDVSAISKGIYILRIHNKDKVLSRKVVLE
jgi:choice-of-anchor B domain-containing protein